ncbi:YheC/YheD family endospore coat-associated protein [Alicyclobacillus tolerans]|uniref:Glutathione synthase/RimK-type ligase, ATP-grasp superfamily n=2 Tax=Alicyclobacillus tolerans TaxID=90970 RepID=A0A1M6X5W6_9BACL|nr:MULTISPECIES: YheC/YheD family protein [Alicyclobacillus]MDP9728924.1 glutathione synthase/RimK-type ligase-like ATP-grasp enzyme [Alicyclobacillus tengchongensis]SHL01397.1 Glutathione synthase/RimK-type ligase, ATP-grasp superfamily [Alicyclobacillus montanus]
MNQQSSVSIGILCNPLWQSQQKTLRDNSEMANWKKILETASSLGVKAYIFGLNDLQFEKNMLRAYSWDGIRFTEEQIPMPHVIYDQLASRKLERSQRLRDRRKRLSEMYGLRIFNDGFFDKWQVYEWLSENQAIRSALPATILHRQRDRTKQFMERHGSVYIKPIHGSLGIGIIRLLQTADGTVQYQWKSGRKKVVQGQMASFDKWLEQFGKRLRQRPYICQESIRLATYEGRPFDIRILMQRDGSGQWKRTKAFARVARIGDFTSNLSSGGLALPLSQVLSQIWKEHRQYNQVRQRINDLARKVVQHLQEECEHTLGELGVDVGVTPSGQVYVIEVNSKPHKTPTTQAGRQDLVDLSFRRPIEFAVYLAQTHLGSKAGES